VVDELHNSNFTLDTPVNCSFVGQRGLGDDLDGNLLIRFAMTSKLYTSYLFSVKGNE
jgi:hypothetical protein